MYVIMTFLPTHARDTMNWFAYKRAKGGRRYQP